jgi:tyrosinase
VQVDRLLSLWQYLHPEEWVAADGDPVHDENTGPSRISVLWEVLRSKPDLVPFWNGPASFFKSSDKAIKEWTGLKYTYPEFQDLPSDLSKHRDHIRGVVTRLYNSRDTFPRRAPSAPLAVRAGPQANFSNIALSSSPINLRLAANVAPALPPVAQPINPQAPEEVTEWTTRVRALRFCLGMTFTVLFFLGSPPNSVEDWRDSDDLVGTYINFANSDPESCPNCMQNLHSEDVGYVDLTPALRLRLVDLEDQGHVEQYLKQNLTWRVQKV